MLDTFRGIKNPENIFHIMKRKKERSAAICWLGVSATVIIPKRTKYIKLKSKKNMNQKNLAATNGNPIIG